MNKNHRWTMFFLFFALISIFSIISLFTAGLAIMNNDRIAYGVRIGELPLSGLTEAAAREKIAGYCQQKLSGPGLLLRHEQQQWYIRPADIALQTDIPATAAAAYAVGRSANPLTNLWENLTSAFSGHPLAITAAYDENKLQQLLIRTEQQVNRSSRDASCTLLENGKIKIEPEVTGLQFKSESFAATLRPELLALNFSQVIDLPVEPETPEITSADLQSVDTVISSYSTRFNRFNFNRSENIRIGAEKLSQTLLRPGQLFSFNETVGQRVAAAGYREAPAIIDGETVPDIGGGICQVSSTLYNAMLLAGLEATERAVHFYPSTYVPIGFDATVADNLLDFKFKNSFSRNIYIMASAGGGYLTVYLLGNHEDRPADAFSLHSTIDKTIPPETTIKYSPALRPGSSRLEDSGSNGYIVSAYRIKLHNGQEIERELLHQDQYSPRNRILLVGGN